MDFLGRLVVDGHCRDLSTRAVPGVGAGDLHRAELAKFDALECGAHVRAAVRGGGRGEESA